MLRSFVFYVSSLLPFTAQAVRKAAEYSAAFSVLGSAPNPPAEKTDTFPVTCVRLRRIFSDTMDMHIIDLGLTGYAAAAEAQAEAARKARQGGLGTLFLLEHTPTITFGRNGGEENLPYGRDFFTARGITVLRSSRGGNITCHFPGQLVVYPVMLIDRRPGGLRRFFFDLEESAIRTLHHFGIAAERIQVRSGVWVQGRKICSIGIAVKHWVTCHGLSLNIATDLSLFEQVAPCGLPGVAATSLNRERHGESVTMDEAKEVFTREFCSVFRVRRLRTNKAAPARPVGEKNTAAPSGQGHDAKSVSKAGDSPCGKASGGPRLPPWLKRPLPAGGGFAKTRSLVQGLQLATVCREAKCPNMGECFSRGTATFLILGEVCTRCCAFCNISGGKPVPPDPSEAGRVAAAAVSLKLSHVVITSVTRDDLADGGAAHFAATIRAVRAALPDSAIEVLIPDFRGSDSALRTVSSARPQVINHNVETHPLLYADIRPQADYARSLQLLARVRAKDMVAKSGFMVGLGETDEHVRELLADLAEAGCTMVTIGQYMRPSRAHPEVKRYVPPDVFEKYGRWGKELGLPHVFSAPLARSSYQAAEALEALRPSSRLVASR